MSRSDETRLRDVLAALDAIDAHTVTRDLPELRRTVMGLLG